MVRFEPKLSTSIYTTPSQRNMRCDLILEDPGCEFIGMVIESFRFLVLEFRFKNNLAGENDKIEENKFWFQ